MASTKALLFAECTAELIGTWLLTFIGTGSVAAAVALGAQVGLWQVAVVWGFGVSLSIFLTRHTSGAHLNPAVSISLAISGKHPWGKVLPYITAQFLGAILAGCAVLIVFGSSIARYEARNYVERGAANSTLSAMMFGEYFPNPQVVKSETLLEGDVSVAGALFVEALGTMVLMIVIRSVTDNVNGGSPTNGMVPYFIGFTVATLISLLAPLTQAGFNPARDFGPRIVAYAAGWGSIAIPGPRNGFFVYILGPIIGASAGGLLYDVILARIYRTSAVAKKLLGAEHAPFDLPRPHSASSQGYEPYGPFSASSDLKVQNMELYRIVEEACKKSCSTGSTALHHRCPSHCTQERSGLSSTATSPAGCCGRPSSTNVPSAC